jgi:hypothetical protein
MRVREVKTSLIPWSDKAAAIAKKHPLYVQAATRKSVAPKTAQNNFFVTNFKTTPLSMPLSQKKRKKERDCKTCHTNVCVP